MNLEDFNDIKIFKDRYLQLTFAVKESKIPGYILEFGVYMANSTNHIARLNLNKILYAFDSFEGLPEEWLFSAGHTKPKGFFKLDELPQVISNVTLVKGWFKDTIPKWKEIHEDPISFIHIDSDIYSSCKTVLTELNEQIVPGTIIVFDELFKGTNYGYWERHEWKALNEWCEKYNRECEAISKSNRYSATIRVKK